MSTSHLQLVPRVNIMSSEEFEESSDTYKAIILRQHMLALEDSKMLASKDPAGKDLPEKLPPNMSSSEFLGVVFKGLECYSRFARPESRARTGDRVEQLAPTPFDMMYGGNLAYNVAHFHLMVGAPNLTLQEGLKWMRVAAFHGHPMAIYEATLMLIGSHQEAHFPIRLNLSLLGLSGSTIALQLLSARWPEYYDMVLHAIQENPLGYETSKELLHRHGFEGLGEGGSSIRSIYLKQKTVHAQFSVDTIERLVREAEALDWVLRLSQGGLDTVDLGDAAASAFHHLSQLPDSQAASLADSLFQRGARIDERIPIDCPTHSHAIGSPILAAIRRGKIELALAIFRLHIRHKIPIPDGPIVPYIAFCYLNHELGDGLLSLLLEGPSASPVTPWDADWTNAELTRILCTLVCPSPQIIKWERRIIHGPDHDTAYRRTVEVLMSKGANPCGVDTEGPNSSALCWSLRADDLIGTKLFIGHIEAHRLRPVLASATAAAGFECWEADAIALCISSRSIRCFHLLVEIFPQALDARRTDGRTLLHVACELVHDSDLRFVETLCKSGVDALAQDWQGLTPLNMALYYGHMSAADLLFKTSPEQQLSRDATTGRSTFSTLVGGWVVSNSEEKSRILDAIRWMIEHDGVHFYGIQGIPIWRDILCHFRPPQRSDQIQDFFLIDLLLRHESFASRINKDRRWGLTMLQAAAHYGHVEIVKLLVQHGAEINAVFDVTQSPHEADLRMAGWTALDMVKDLWGRSVLGLGFPRSIKSRGPSEMRQWVKDMDIISSFLTEHGAESRDNEKQAR